MALDRQTYDFGHSGSGEEPLSLTQRLNCLPMLRLKLTWHQSSCSIEWRM